MRSRALVRASLAAVVASLVTAGPVIAAASVRSPVSMRIPAAAAPSDSPDPSTSADPSNSADPSRSADPSASASNGPEGQVVQCEDELKPKNWIAQEGWASQWLQLTEARKYASGLGVTVAVVDTGLAVNPQFVGTAVAESDAVDVIGNLENNESAFLDCDGHGTGVASIIAARAYNKGSGNKSSLIGVAPRARILPVRVTAAAGTGSSQDLADGIVWAVDHGADIINTSLETDSNFAPLRQAVEYAGQKGVLIVAASGNQAKNGNPPAYPALYSKQYSHVIAVGAIDQTGKRAEFSGTSAVTVMAPGVGIITAWPRMGNGLEEGTSFAAPYVAGVAALILDRYDKKLTPADVRRRIEVTADTVPGRSSPDKETGYGVISPVDAITAVLPNLASARPSVKPQGIPPLKPPPAADNTVRNAALGVTAGALVIVIGAVAGVATVRRGRARKWRPGT